MAFEIQNLSWYKRRKATVEPKPVAVEIPDFKTEQNHFCTVSVVFDNGGTALLQGRVTQNRVTGQWMVSGINASGQSVSVRFVPE